MLALASVATRPVFWHFVVWLKVVWYVLAVTSVVVFGLRRGAAVGEGTATGTAAVWPPAGQLPGLLWRGLRELLSHASIGRRDTTAGWAQRAIFYGFLVLSPGR